MVTCVALATVAAASGVLLSRHSSPPVALAAAQPPVPEQFRVAPVLGPGGSPVLFARASTGRLVTDTFANGNWVGWRPVPGTPPITGVPAVTSAGGSLVVLARASTGRLLYLRQPVGGSWDAPVRIGSRPVTSSPAVLQVGGTLEAFARLSDGELGVATLSGGSWSEWKKLGGDLAGPPVAALDLYGNPNVFAISPFGALIHDAYIGGAWTGVQDLPGGNYTGVPAIGTNPDGRLEAFVRTTGGIVRNVWQQPGNLADWGGPQDRITTVASDPATSNVSQNRIVVFVLGTSSTVLHIAQVVPHAGTPWTGQAPLGTSLTGTPAAIRLGNGQLELFVRSQAGTIATAVRDPGQATWSGLIPIGGHF